MQSFADLWVDFLLKETEEREKRESSGNSGKATEDSSNKSPNTIPATPPFTHKSPNSIPATPPFSNKSPNTISATPPFSNRRFDAGKTSAFQISPINQNVSPPPRVYFQRSEHFDSEFSTVPLTSSDAKTTTSNPLPRY